MPLRLIDVLLPDEHGDRVQSALDEETVLEHWDVGTTDGRAWHRIMVRQQDAEGIMDRLSNRFGHVGEFRLILHALEVTVPKPEEPEPEPEDPAKPKKKFGWQRLSRQELLSRIDSAATPDRTFIASVILSVVVATAGLLQSNAGVVIAAMVIAPLLGPNIAFALATVTGDGALARRAVITNLKGVGLALVIAIAIAPFFPVDEMMQSFEIADRTKPGLAMAVLALAAGAAGAMSFTTGLSGALIGVMVAVALLPPLLVVGLMLGNGAWSKAAGAALLLGTNIVGVNLAAVGMFAFQGVTPGRWWEQDKAKKATRKALIAWGAATAVAVVLLVLAQRWFQESTH